MNIKHEIEQIYDELVTIRRDFHMNPELSCEEFETSHKISHFLNKNGISYESDIAQTGVVGLIQGTKPSASLPKTVALRADIDALPIQEMTDVPYRSRIENVMHACGHDVHTTILMGVAKILQKNRHAFSGNIKLLFQPAEETVGGALPMIEAGCLDNPKVDYVLGLHVMPYLQTGMVELKYGKLNAASDYIKIVIKGKSGHGAYPEQSTDAIAIAGHVLVALQTLVSRNTSPLNSVVLSFGTISGGVKGNVIADEVVLTGTLRTLDSDTRRFAKERIVEIASNQAKSFRGEAKVEISEGYEPLINDDETVSVLSDTAHDLLGPENIVFKDAPSLGVEDFSYFSNRVKGAFFHLGCGDIEQGISASLHNSSFNVNESCMKTGILVEIATVLRLLDK